MKRVLFFKLLLGLLFLQCNPEAEIVVDKVKITFKAQHKIQGNVLALTGNVSIANNIHKKEFDIGLTYSDHWKTPTRETAFHKHVKVKAKKSFDFSFAVTLEAGKTYWARLFAHDGKATVYGDVFKVVVDSNSNAQSITLSKPKKDAVNVVQNPAFEWSSSLSGNFNLFLKKEGDADFTKKGDGVTSPFSLAAPLEKNQRYYWYVVHRGSNTRSATSNFFTQTVPKLDVYSAGVLGYTQDATGNQYLLLQEPQSYINPRSSFTFQGKTYNWKTTLLVKKSPTGDVLKVKEFVDTGLTQIPLRFVLYLNFRGFRMDKAGNLYVNVSGRGGFTYGTTTSVTPISTNETTTTTLKLDNDLNVVWKKTVQSRSYVTSSGVTPQSGFYPLYIRFDANENGESVLALAFRNNNIAGKDVMQQGKYDILLIKYDAAGDEVYKHSFATTENDKLLAVDIDKQGKVTLGVRFGRDKFIYHNKVKTAHKTIGMVFKDPGYSYLLYFNADGSSYELNHPRSGLLLSLATNSRSELYEFYFLEKPAAVQGTNVPANTYYFAKHSTNTKNGTLQGWDKFLVRDKSSNKFYLSVSSDTPYIFGSAFKINGLGINYISPNPKRSVLVAMQINSNTRQVDWIKTTEDSKNVYIGTDGYAYGVFKNTKGVFIYGVTNPSAKIDGKALSGGMVYKK